jgi:pimeloyl-ACP methyl ester carboxylesterase
MPQFYNVTTSAGKVNLWDTAKGDSKRPAVVCIHANSTNKFFFREQMQSNLTRNYRFVAIDLPGHGNSDYAKDAYKTYSFPGYAQVVAEVVNKLGLKEVALLGWSLGGHVALEMSDCIEGLKGIFLTGTPPIELSDDGVYKGFKKMPKELLALLGKQDISMEEAKLFMQEAGYDGDEDDEFMIDSCLRTDGLARQYMFEAMHSGVGRDETEIVAHSDTPIAVVGGKEDLGINYDYVRSLRFKNLWRGDVHLVEGAKHAVLLEKPDEFNAFLGDFLKEVFLDQSK